MLGGLLMSITAPPLSVPQLGIRPLRRKRLRLAPYGIYQTPVTLGEPWDTMRPCMTSIRPALPPMPGLQTPVWHQQEAPPSFGITPKSAAGGYADIDAVAEPQFSFGLKSTTPFSGART